MTTWKKHSTLKIEIKYVAEESVHDNSPLKDESVTLQGFYRDYDLFGLPQRDWLFAVVGDQLTHNLGVKKSKTGEAQLLKISSEGLEVLRNVGRLGDLAEQVLNRRGRSLLGVPEEGRPALGPGSGQDPGDGLPEGS